MLVALLRYLPMVLVGVNLWYSCQTNAHFRRAFFFEWAIVLGWLVLLWGIDFKTKIKPGLNLSIPGGLGLIALILVGIVTRIAGLDVYPASDANVVEEVQTGGIAFRSLRDGGLDPDFPLTNLLGEVGIKFFGHSMLGLRWPFAIWSCLGVPVFFFAARSFFRNELTALLISLLFATNTYVIASGRTAMETFAPITTVVGALAALFYARRRGTVFSYALAGTINGLLCIEYFSFRFVAAMNLAWVILILAQGSAAGPMIEDTRKLRWGEIWKAREKLCIFILLMASIALPCWIELARGSWLNLVEGINRNFVNQVLPASTGRSLGLLLQEGVHKILRQANSLFFGGPEMSIVSGKRGILDPVTSVMGIGAMVYAFFTARTDPSRWWPTITTLGAIFLAAVLTVSIGRYRVFCALPFFLLGLGILLDDILLGRSIRRNPVIVGALTAIILGLSTWNVWDFRRTVHDSAVSAEYYDFTLLVAQELKTQQQTPAGKPLYLLAVGLLDEYGGDFVFLYNRSEVRFVESLAEIHGPARVLACNNFVLDVEQSADFRILKRWQDTPKRAEQFVIAERN